MARHPGHILREAFLDPLGIRPAELARAIGVERSTVSRLLAGKLPLTPAMAGRLGVYFEVPALWWLQMQAAFDAQNVEHDSTIRREVTPWTQRDDVLLTPTGVLALSANPRPPEPPLTIRYEDFARIQLHEARPRRVSMVSYENGGQAVVGDDP